MPNDFFSSIRSQIQERISNPFTGAFAISWLAWNYRYAMVLISFEPVSAKLNLIDKLFYSTTWSITDIDSLLMRGILLPIATALAYLFLYPYPTRIIYKIVHMNRLKLRELRQSIENQKRLSLEESRVLITRTAVLQNRYNEEIADLHTQIRQLTDVIAEKKKKNRLAFVCFYYSIDNQNIAAITQNSIKSIVGRINCIATMFLRKKRTFECQLYTSRFDGDI